MSHTKKPNVCLSTRLCYRDAHNYASFFSNGRTGSKAGRKALCRFQNAGARWALGTESQVQMETESSHLCQQESCRKGSKNGSEAGQQQAARRCIPSDGFLLSLGRILLGGGKKARVDRELPLLQQPQSQPLGTEGCPTGSQAALWVKRMGRGGDDTAHAFLLLSYTISLDGHWDEEMKMKFLFRVVAGLFIAL